MTKFRKAQLIFREIFGGFRGAACHMAYPFVVSCSHSPAPRLGSGISSGLNEVTPVTDPGPIEAHALKNWKDIMPGESVTFHTLSGAPKKPSNCSICNLNPATLRFSGALEGDCCLPCACAALANLAQLTVDCFTKPGTA
jgi:hypothetical protein